MARFFSLIAVAGLVLAGCNEGSDTQVTKRPSTGTDQSTKAPPKSPILPDTSKETPKTGGATTEKTTTADNSETAAPTGSPPVVGTYNDTTPPADNTAKDNSAKDDPQEEKLEELSVDQLLSRAMNAGQQGNLDEADRSVAAALAKEPKHPQATTLAFHIARSRGAQLMQGASGNEEQIKAAHAQFIAAADYFRTLREVDPELAKRFGQLGGMAIYNAACAYAMKGEKAEAMKALQEAYESGMNDVGMLDTDADLASLRDLPEFATLKAEVTRKIAEAAREHAQELLAKGETFPFQLELTSVDDTQALNLEELKGKVVIVDIWGTWCPPCRMEIPHFVALVEKYADQGLNIIGVNYEQGEPEAAKENVKKFMADNKMNYPCALGDEATQSQVPNFEGFPTTMFIDRTGKVRLKAVGYHDYATLSAIVEVLLAEKADGAPAAGAAAAGEAAGPAADVPAPQ